MHFRRLWNGMFDRHWAEIIVMQFTSYSLPVHQLVTVPRDFNPVPYCQPSSPTPMEYATSASLEWHVWPGRRSIYYKCNDTLEFELTYYDVAIQHISHYDTLLSGLCWLKMRISIVHIIFQNTKFTQYLNKSKHMFTQKCNKLFVKIRSQ